MVTAQIIGKAFLTIILTGLILLVETHLAGTPAGRSAEVTAVYAQGQGFTTESRSTQRLFLSYYIPYSAAGALR